MHIHIHDYYKITYHCNFLLKLFNISFLRKITMYEYKQYFNIIDYGSNRRVGKRILHEIIKTTMNCLTFNKNNINYLCDY